ncbi:MAG: hypothetical protein WAM77_11420, partial [Xanthobacteraceae bacterium]
MNQGGADAGPEALAAALLLTILMTGATAHAQVAPLSDRVSFASADGHTTLVGYVFKPSEAHAARTPA